MERGFGDVVFTANGLDGVVAIGLAQDADNFLGTVLLLLDGLLLVLKKQSQPNWSKSGKSRHRRYQRIAVGSCGMLATIVPENTDLWL